MTITDSELEMIAERSRVVNNSEAAEIAAALIEARKRIERLEHEREMANEEAEGENV